MQAAGADVWLLDNAPPSLMEFLKEMISVVTVMSLKVYWKEDVGGGGQNLQKHKHFVTAKRSKVLKANVRRGQSDVTEAKGQTLLWALVTLDQGTSGEAGVLKPHQYMMQDDSQSSDFTGTCPHHKEREDVPSTLAENKRGPFSCE
ncbi:hypothetical protein CB1_000743043 [Camelus ferus]|nr:hypothetical protein CB1_000743043 [Camelus ferus]